MPKATTHKSLSFLSLQDSACHVQDHNNSLNCYTEPHDAAAALVQAVNSGKQAFCLALHLQNTMHQVPPAARSQHHSARGAAALLTQMSFAGRGRQAPLSPLPSTGQLSTWKLHTADFPTCLTKSNFTLDLPDTCKAAQVSSALLFCAAPGTQQSRI